MIGTWNHIFSYLWARDNQLNNKAMETKNTSRAPKIEAHYVIDYVYDNPGGINFYHQLVRQSDNAILYANENLDNVFLRCWELGIKHNDVVVL